MKRNNGRHPLFAVAKGPTPLINTPDLARVFSGEGGAAAIAMNRALETIAFPGTKFKVLAVEESPFALKVETSEYPYGAFYIDRRFVDLQDNEPPERKRVLPPKGEIIERMRSLRGLRYVWGGNWPEGIPTLTQYYSPLAPFDLPELEEAWCLKGVDCSGLLYYATGGYTPRNTSSLMQYGREISVQGGDLQPLDLIVWTGHVVIVSEEGLAIESRGGRGVIETPLNELMAELFQRQSRGEISKLFMRRWC